MAVAIGEGKRARREMKIKWSAAMMRCSEARLNVRRRCIGSPFAFTVPAANVASSGSALKRHL